MTEVLRLGKSPKPLDLELVEEGARFEAPMAPGVFVTIAPWGDYSPRYRRASERRTVRRVLGEKEGASEKGDAEEVALSRFDEMCDDPEFVVDALVIDMEGLLNAKGNPVQYTRERGIAILARPEWWHLRRWIADKALELTLRMKRGVEEEEKN